MLIQMKKFLSKYWKPGLSVAFGLVVFLFWRFRYPFALAYQEQFQLFLFEDDYFLERIVEPGGFARYVAEFLLQFYNDVTLGALILAFLFVLIQRLTWLLMHTENHYALSFIPVAVLWFAMGDEGVLLTYVVALAMALAIMTAWILAKNCSWIVKWGVVFFALPIVYWLLGPMVLLVALWMLPISIIYALVLMFLSAYVLPFSTMRVMFGISYYRFPEILPYELMIVPVLIILMGYFVRLLPKMGRWVNVMEVTLVVVLLGGLLPLGFDKKKYELIEYDYLVRIKDWNAIIAKAEKQMPDLPMSVSATNLALAMTNQLGDRAFEFYQRGSEGLMPKFERNFATTQLTGEIYYHLGLVNTAQRFAFEAMEAIPNYNKSGRVFKRLAETNLINREYKVAEKYLRMLEKTIFYRRWAQRMLTMIGDEKAIDSHPLYGTLRKYRLKEDFLFSDRELDKICGQLFMHCHENQMAAQYLLMAPLLDKDLPRFMQYAQYVQSQIRYNPRSCQEAIAFAFMQQRQQPPQGLISPMVMQQMSDFAQTYSNSGQQSPDLNRFRNTVWYYLTVGK